MNINSGIIPGNRNQTLIFRNDDLWLMNEDCASYVLLNDYTGARFLSACPHGVYLAFWSDRGESFRLIDIAGQELWSCWMNTDKATPHGIHFSSSGDAVACLYDFEGLPGLFLCDIERAYTTTFGCSGSPIGYDAGLQYFVIDSCDPYESESLAFYENDASSGGVVKVPPQAVSARMKASPLVVSRDRCLYSYPVVPVRAWDGLAIQDGMEGFVILKDGNLSWFNSNADKPEVTIADCIPQSDASKWFRCTLDIGEDNALVQCKDRSIAANRYHGVVWRGNDLSSTMLKGNHILAQYDDGTVAVIRNDGSIEIKYLPPPGFRTVAADIVDSVLNIASISRLSHNLHIKTCKLAG